MSTEGGRYILTEPQQGLDDELDLIDLIRVLVKYKWLISLMALIAAALGGLFAFLSNDQYQYTARVEIGAYYNNTDGETLSLIEPAQIVLDKLKSGYIPKVIYDYEKKNNEILRGDIKVTAPKNSNIIVLETTGSKGEETKLIGVLSGSVELLLKNHDLRTSSQKKEINTRLSKAELRLTMLMDKRIFDLDLLNVQGDVEKAKHALKETEDGIKIIHSGIEKIGFEGKLLIEQEKILISRQAEITNLLRNMDKQRESAIKVASNSNSVMTLMLLDNERRQLYGQQVNVTNQINLDLKKNAHDLINQKERLMLDLEQIHRNEKLQQDEIIRLKGELTKLKFQRKIDTENQKQNILALQARLSSIIPTSIIVGPVRSFRPDSKRAFYIPMFVILGLFLALLVIAVLEIKKKLQETDNLSG